LFVIEYCLLFPLEIIGKYKGLLLKEQISNGKQLKKILNSV